MSDAISNAAVTIVEGSAQSVDDLSSPVVKKGHDKVAAPSKENGTEEANSLGFFEQDKVTGKQKWISIGLMAEQECEFIVSADKARMNHYLHIGLAFKDNVDALKAYFPALKAALEKAYGLKGRADRLTASDKKENEISRPISAATVATYTSQAKRIFSALAQAAEDEDFDKYDLYIAGMKNAVNMTKFLASVPKLQANMAGRKAASPEKALEGLKKKAKELGVQVVVGKVQEKTAEPSQALKPDLTTPAAAAVVEATGGTQSAFASIISFLEGIKDPDILDQITQKCAIVWQESFGDKELCSDILNALTAHDKRLETEEGNQQVVNE